MTIRILYLITATDFGGAETLLYQQVANLDRNRFEAVVCSVKPEGRVARRIAELGIRTETLNLELRRDIFRPWRVIRAVRRFHRLVMSVRPQILHASLFQADVLGALVGAWCGVPVRLATLHMVLRRLWPELVIERLISPWVTRYIAVSRNIKHVYVSRLLLPEKKIVYIPNSVRTEDIEKKSAATLIEPTLFDSRRTWFTMVGRLDPQKDLKTLLLAVRLLKERSVPVGVLLIGDGPSRAGLESLARELQVQNEVKFLGYQINPFPYLTRSNGLVLSSREEGLPLVILEAMALGKPIVATGVGAVGEAVIHGESGLIVSSGSSNQLATAMEELVTNPVKAQEMGQRGRMIFEKSFSLSSLQRRLEDLYILLHEKKSPL